MCTLSWKLVKNGYEVHFNRDERRQRVLGLPPQIDDSAAYPIDPQGGGTWISTNKFGITLALINNYGAEMALNRAAAQSRGLVITQLCQLQTKGNVLVELEQKDWSAYNPFDLFVFSPNSEVTRLAWDGFKGIMDNPREPMAFSAGFDANEVVTSRKKLFEEFRRIGRPLDDYHASHRPSRSHLSVCMHRPEAHTVSYTRVRVDDSVAQMSYRHGPACGDAPLQNLEIELSASPESN